MKNSKVATQLKLTLIVIFIAGMLGAGLYFYFNENKAGNTLSDELFGWKYPVVKFPQTGPSDLAYSDIRDPGGVPDGLPVRLKIPAIGVNSAIEDALITPDGRMDVPAGSRNVAWFALGPHPGRVGSAVIGGHYGTRNGVPFVFYRLDHLKVGDKVYVEDDRGDTLAFVVRSIRLFDRNADATDVFTSGDGLAHLNLITCEGIWNRVNDTYPERRVVFTDAIPAEGAAPASAVFRRSLGIGAEGADVTALQTILEQKGLLMMPSGVAKGFFGTLTGVAVAQYQASAGLPPVGIFGPLTRLKLNSELANSPGFPNTATDLSLENILVPSQTFIQSVKSLYANPLDGAITSLLLIAIVYMALVIVRRRRSIVS